MRESSLAKACISPFMYTANAVNEEVAQRDAFECAHGMAKHGRHEVAGFWRCINKLEFTKDILACYNYGKKDATVIHFRIRM